MNHLPPLAERLRPKSLQELLGQDSLTNSAGLLSKISKSGHLPSLIFWGPPGSGKTSLAKILAENSGSTFHQISAIHSGVKEIREIIEQSKKGSLFSQGIDVLFIDEIHRFNKSQQDSLLEAVEKGWVILLGATTENPSFEVIPALLSRCQVIRLNPLEKPDLEKLIQKAILQDSVLKHRKITLQETDSLIAISGGDARRMLNLLELMVMSFPEDPFILTNDLVKSVLEKNPLAYDKSGDQHYDTISAFIKSVRGSDPNAALYWLSKMILSGENPLFIARRLLVLASEDIGNANPQGLILANACFQAVHSLGMPEARITLSQTTLFLACSPKSNSAYQAIEKALNLVKNSPSYPVPMHLRNAPTEFMKDQGFGLGYLYPHDFEGNFTFQTYLPEEIQGTEFYKPGSNPEEAKTKAFLQEKWKKDL